MVCARDVRSGKDEKRKEEGYFQEERLEIEHEMEVRKEKGKKRKKEKKKKTDNSLEESKEGGTDKIKTPEAQLHKDIFNIEQLSPRGWYTNVLAKKRSRELERNEDRELEEGQKVGGRAGNRDRLWPKEEISSSEKTDEKASSRKPFASLLEILVKQ